MQNINEWRVSGKVFYVKELQGEFAASVKIRGIATRPDSYATNIMEVTCLMTKEVYEQAKLAKYDTVTLSGHIETWERVSGQKISFIADVIESVEAKNEYA